MEQPAKPSLKSRLYEFIKRVWSIRFVRFLVIGAINTLFSYLVYALLILLNVHYSIASLVSTILGIIFNFFTTGRIVFNNKENKLILKFFMVYLVTYLVNLLCLRGLELLHMDMLIAGAITTLPIALLSYLLNSIFVFKKFQLPGRHQEKQE
jgi:putative flippase GtrA